MSLCQVPGRLLRRRKPLATADCRSCGAFLSWSGGRVEEGTPYEVGDLGENWSFDYFINIHNRLVEEQAAWADVFGISHNSTQVETPVRVHS